MTYQIRTNQTRNISVGEETLAAVDVICQHTRQREIIPLKIRNKDEDGAYQEYRIKSYQILESGLGEQRLPNEVVVKKRVWRFQVVLHALGMQKKAILLYDSLENLWSIQW